MQVKLSADLVSLDAVLLCLALFSEDVKPPEAHLFSLCTSYRTFVSAGPWDERTRT